VGRKFRKLALNLNSATTCSFFFSSFNKISIIHFFFFFFCFSNVGGILQI
jgi:hypothetical protein